MLTDQDHDDMDFYFGHVLKDFEAGRLTQIEAVSELAHVFTALDERNGTEVTQALRAARARGRP